MGDFILSCLRIGQIHKCENHSYSNTMESWKKYIYIV